MGSLNRLATGLRALVTRSRAERELDEELRSYLDAATDQKIAEGMTRREVKSPGRPG